jgi:hypothetical protein
MQPPPPPVSQQKAQAESASCGDCTSKFRRFFFQKGVARVAQRVPTMLSFYTRTTTSIGGTTSCPKENKGNQLTN